MKNELLFGGVSLLWLSWYLDSNGWMVGRVKEYINMGITFGGIALLVAIPFV